MHSKDHWEMLQGLPDQNHDYLVAMTEKADTVYYNAHTAMAARLAAGSALEVCKQIVDRHIRRGFAVVRPPGHHAEHGKCRGFCMLNNVAIAARFALTRQGVERVMILDFDVHHGQATQQMFEDSSEVLFVSIHRYDNGRFYPCGKKGAATQVGKGPGKGYNVNIPWNTSGVGDPDYMFALKQIVVPIAESYRPDLVLISAGFDAAKGDPFGQCNVSPAGYAHMVRAMMEICPKVLCVLEGGYNLDSIERSAHACVEALFSEKELPSLDKSQLLNPGTAMAIHQVRGALAKHWPGCL